MLIITQVPKRTLESPQIIFDYSNFQDIVLLLKLYGMISNFYWYNKHLGIYFDFYSNNFWQYIQELLD